MLLQLFGVLLVASSTSPATTSPKTTKTCVTTISCWNNFAHVLTFMEAAMASNNQIDCWVWAVADRPEFDNKVDDKARNLLQNIRKRASFFRIATIPDLQPYATFSLLELAFKYNLVEFNTAIKSTVFRYALDHLNATRVLYFDNDVWIMHSVAYIESLLTTYSIVITPHITSPMPFDGKDQADKQIGMAGIFNFGFVAMSESPATRAFLDWWTVRLRFYGYNDKPRGMHFDQGWGNFIPAFLGHEEYFVLRDPAYNVAYWNLHYTGSRLSTDSRGKVYLKRARSGRDEPVVFMHFSGISNFNFFKSTFISRHQNRYTLLDMPQLRPILTRYVTMLEERNASTYRLLPYGYNYFDSGLRLIPAVRELYAAVLDPDADRRRQAFFLERVYQPNPFDGTLPSISTIFPRKKMNVLQWLFAGPYDLALNLVGEEYTPEILWHVADLTVSDWQERALGSSRNKLWFWFLSNYLSTMKDDAGRDLNLVAANLFVRQRNATKIYDNQSFGINLFGWSGRSVLDLRHIIKLAGVPLRILELPTVSGKASPEVLQCSEDLASRIAPFFLNLFVMDNGDATKHVQCRLPPSVLKDHYNIAFWNLDKVPALDQVHLYDEIWVPTAFTRDLFSHRNVPPVYITHPTVGNIQKREEDLHTHGSAATRRILSDLKPKAFLFLVIVDKNWENANVGAALDAFVRFSTTYLESAHLFVLDTIEQFKTHERLARLVARVRNAHLILESESLVRSRLLQRADCLISLHRLLKFQYEIWDMFTNAKAVLLTNYSGPADLLQPAYAAACASYGKRHPCATAPWLIPYQVKQNRITPDIQATAVAMRSIFTHFQAHSEFAITLRDKLRKIYPTDRLAELVRTRISAIATRRNCTTKFTAARIIASQDCRDSISIRSSLTTAEFPHHSTVATLRNEDTRPLHVSPPSVPHSLLEATMTGQVALYHYFIPAVSGLILMIIVLLTGFSPAALRRRCSSTSALSQSSTTGRGAAVAAR